MRLDDFEVTINCAEGINGASALTATTMGAAALVVASLY
jgi:hypothetical protein|tara:strand:+ start:814 stop:930 length:117 start_codon:yes stop_codon:yes gene_type:complete